MSTSKLKVYLAGPITGKTGEEVIRRYDEKKALLSDFGYEVYSPMTGKGYLRNEPGPLKSTGYTMPLATDQAIFHRDRWMVGVADVILADLSNSGERVSIGTMFEIAWANILRKQVVVVLPEGNIHDHAFVKQASTIIFQDIEEAYDYLKELSASREWQDR
jgi:nucleoside 2-deoxyribosyltransferase